MSTIKDVARVSGLSIATISKYMNGGNVLEENRVNIQAAIESLGYQRNDYARSLKTNQTMTIGILIPSFVNVFFMSIVSIIESVLQEKGYGCIVCDYKEDTLLEQKKLEFLKSKNVDGIVMVSFSGDTVALEKLKVQGIPVILLDRMIRGYDCDVVLADNLNASYEAIDALLIKNHRRIGIVCGPKASYTAEEREKGYISAHQDYHIPVDPSLIYHGHYTVESGYDAMQYYWQLSQRPSAVLFTNYELTVGAIMAINDLSIAIPDELSIIGFDNIQLAQVVKPSLAVVEQPMQAIGETAAKLLLKRLSGDTSDFPTVHRLKTKVLLNGSVRDQS